MKGGYGEINLSIYHRELQVPYLYMVSHMRGSIRSRTRTRIPRAPAHSKWYLVSHVSAQKHCTSICVT